MAGLNTSESREELRVQQLFSGDEQAGKCVVYVMSRDQRVRDNHALLFAQKKARSLSVPLAVVFCLYSGRGHRAREHYQWMLEGLRQVEEDLAQLNIPFLLLIGDPIDRLKGLMRHTTPAAIFFDYSPLKGPKCTLEWAVSERLCSVYVVDTHNIVPVWLASDKQEVGARTLRPKIHRQLTDFLTLSETISKHPTDWPGKVMSMADLGEKIEEFLGRLQSNKQKELLSDFPPGERSAKLVLRQFISSKLKDYAANRNDPTIDGLSDLSPYLHFGTLSSLQVVLQVMGAVHDNPILQAGMDALVEEMVVRKELSDNFCHHNPCYDSLDGAPNWAKTTLQKHREDPRDFIYDRGQFERAETHDPAWNAAQRQLLSTGKMHGYMRMYWAKKVLEWSSSPEDATEILIYLNDFYSIDGGDPNGYVGILWSVAGLHDRPWGERPVYGTVRCMVYAGLKRKFNIKQYELTYGSSAQSVLFD